jgi:hypothetical protein
MNTLGVMRHGHRTVLQTVAGLERERQEVPNVVGVWSTKDIIAHLSSFEAVLIDVLTTIRDDDAATPLLDSFRAGPAEFNDAQVAMREHLAPDDVLREYEANFEAALELARALPDDVRTRNGLLEWYGSDYDLDDFITYMFYGHKREHTAQIKLFRNTQERGR